MLTTEKFIYKDTSQNYEGVLAYNTGWKVKKPLVIIFHAYGGQSEFESGKAVELAKLGYVALAADVYGQGVRAKTPEDATRLLRSLTDNRSLLLDRLSTVLQAAASIEQADLSNVAVIGYCFGGKCVLDLVRSGVSLKAGVSFHGTYDPPGIEHIGEIMTPLLILHGWDDPIAPPDALVALASELTDRNAEWEVNAFGHASHAFTHPKAQESDRGMMYSQEADRRSWNRMVDFLKDKFE